MPLAKPTLSVNREQQRQSMRRFRDGPRATVRRKGIRPIKLDAFSSIVVDGKFLNIPEARIYMALTDLGIPFEAQTTIGGGRELGGGLADFWLPFHKVVLEYQGPFHNTTAGKARDFYRASTRKQFGALAVIPIYETDLNRLKTLIPQLIGSPGGYGTLRS